MTALGGKNRNPVCISPLFPANIMPAFRQVGEKQLPNPVKCMAWSPKRDLIALANTTGEVGSNAENGSV